MEQFMFEATCNVMSATYLSMTRCPLQLFQPHAQQAFEPANYRSILLSGTWNKCLLLETEVLGGAVVENITL